ncbi:hypothetical protein B0H14DRAFT_2747723, partial [Mycena olivaceomarginata]
MPKVNGALLPNKACLSCKKRKTRCDPGEPCLQCSKRREQCDRPTLELVRSRKRSSRSSITDIDELKAACSSLLSESIFWKPRCSVGHFRSNMSSSAKHFSRKKAIRGQRHWSVVRMPSHCPGPPSTMIESSRVPMPAEVAFMGIFSPMNHRVSRLIG